MEAYPFGDKAVNTSKKYLTNGALPAPTAQLLTISNDMTAPLISRMKENYYSPPAPEPLEIGDANHGEFVNVGNAVYLVDYILKGRSGLCANRNDYEPSVK